jgi:hypothetical protein
LARKGYAGEAYYKEQQWVVSRILSVSQTAAVGKKSLRKRVKRGWLPQSSGYPI